MYAMPTKQINGEGKKLKVFDLSKTPLSSFDACPGKHLPDVKGKLIQIHHGQKYVFQIGATETIHIVEGANEKPRNLGDIEWLQYNAPDRAAHHRYWSVKFLEMQDDKFFPLNFID